MLILLLSAAKVLILHSVLFYNNAVPIFVKNSSPFIKDMDAVIIGSGNTATVLARLMKKNHHTILQIISRHIENAQQLATEINCNFANDISAINKSATIYIIAVSDSVIERIASKIKLEEKLIVHTCGAINKSARVPPAQLDLWLAILGWESVVNRKGQMWRKLDDAAKAAVVDAASSRALLLAQASIIKRPIVDWGGVGTGPFTVGFKEADWTKRLQVF